MTETSILLPVKYYNLSSFKCVNLLCCTSLEMYGNAELFLLHSVTPSLPTLVIHFCNVQPSFLKEVMIFFSLLRLPKEVSAYLYEHMSSSVIRRRMSAFLCCPQNSTSSLVMSISTTSLWYLMSLRAVMASRSGDLISVGPKTMPRFSLDIRFSFSLWITLGRGKGEGAEIIITWRIVERMNPNTVIKSFYWESQTFWGEPWGIAESRSELAAAVSRPRGETPAVFLGQ